MTTSSDAFWVSPLGTHLHAAAQCVRRIEDCLEAIDHTERRTDREYLLARISVHVEEIRTFHASIRAHWQTEYDRANRSEIT